MNFFSDITVLHWIGFFGPKILIAFLCGGIVGLERELKNKAAGIKTNMLICAGSALYTGLSVLISSKFVEDGGMSDPGRIAAQIVSGIGFLGGGAIIQARGTVTGLTTAATIWVVAAIGICIGLGYYATAIACSLLVVGMLVLVTSLEARFLGSSLSFACKILVDERRKGVRRNIMDAIQDNDLNLIDFDLSHKGTLCEIKVVYRGSIADQKKFVLGLWSMDGVKEVRQK